MSVTLLKALKIRYLLRWFFFTDKSEFSSLQRERCSIQKEHIEKEIERETSVCWGHEGVTFCCGGLCWIWFGLSSRENPHLPASLSSFESPLLLQPLKETESTERERERVCEPTQRRNVDARLLVQKMDTPEKTVTQIGTPVSKHKVEVFLQYPVSGFG